MTTPGAADRGGAEDPERGPGGSPDSLFGRGLLFVVGWCLQIGSSVVISPVLAHALGPGQFGALSSAIALNQILIVVAVLGADRAVVVEHNQDSGLAGARTLLALSAVVGTAVTSVALVTAGAWTPVLGLSQHVDVVWPAVLWTAPSAFVQVCLALLMAQDRLRAFTVLNFLATVASQLVGLVLLGARPGSAAAYAWGGVVSLAAAAVLAVVLTRPTLRGVRAEGLVARAVAIGVPLAIAGLSTFVLNASDRLILQRWLGSEEVGRYQIAYTVGSVVVILIGATSAAWTAGLSAIRDEVRRRDVLGTSRDEMVGILLPVVIGLTCGAPVVLSVVAPPSFRTDSLVPVTYLVLVTAFPTIVSTAAERALVMARRSRPIAVSVLIAAVSNVVLNIVLIGPLGVTGAALATVVASGLQAVCLWWYTRRQGLWPRSRVRTVLAAGGTVALGGCALALPALGVDRWLLFGAGVACLPWFAWRIRLAQRRERAV